MIKRLMYVALAFGMVFGLFGQVDEANAEMEVKDCTIVINANKHFGGNPAFPTGPEGCEDLGYGHYQELDPKGFFFSGRIVKNGDVIKGLTTLKTDYRYNVHIKTIPKKQEPKSQPEPKQESKPKQQSQSTSKSKENTQTKQQSQSKQTQSKNTESKQQTQSKQSSQSKQTSQPKQNNTTVKQTTNQVAQNTQKEETKTLQAKGDEQEKNEKENDKDKKDEKLSVDELKDKNAKVVKENGKFYALYKDEKGKDVKQEITEEEAKELGFVEKVEKEEIEKEEPEKVEAKEKEDEKSSKAGIIAGVTTAALAGLGGAGYFIFRRFI